MESLLPDCLFKCARQRQRQLFQVTVAERRQAAGPIGPEAINCTTHVGHGLYSDPLLTLDRYEAQVHRAPNPRRTQCKKAGGI